MLKSSKAAHAACWHFLIVTTTAVALLVLALATPVLTQAGPQQRQPDLGTCQNLQAPAGSKLVVRMYASGVQIYRWTGTSWAFVAPEALLFADSGGNGVVGTHYAGPTWESVSGSTVVGAVSDRCTPDPDAIPWLVLDAVTSDGPGIFHRVTTIQRLDTTGGLAPTAPGGVIGEVARVPYTAVYYFYRLDEQP